MKPPPVDLRTGLQVCEPVLRILEFGSDRPADGRPRNRADVRAVVQARFPALAARRARSQERAVPTPDRDAVVLGRNERHQPVILPLAPRREHMHVIGTTGSGKSNFLRALIRQDISDGRAVFIPDPHGSMPDSLFLDVLTWLDDTGLINERVVHIIDFDAESTVGFNPLARPNPNTDFSVIASDVFEALQRAWGEGEIAGKPVLINPTIRRLLLALFAGLAELGLTLADADLLFDPYDQQGVRQLVVSKLDDRYSRAILADLHQMALDERSKREFRAEVVGPVNRLVEFVRSPAIRRALGQTDRALNFTEAIDEGHIILANLSGGDRVAAGDAELFGRLLTHSLFRAAQRRKYPERPCVFVLDECQKLLSGDVELMLAESRKNGICCVLAHQTLAQLGKPDDSLRVAVQANTNVKVVFRLKDTREAAELAEAVIPLDLEQPVRSLVKPTVVGSRRTLFRSSSSGRNYSTTRSEAATETRSTAETVTDFYSETVGHGTAHSVTNTEGATRSRSSSTGDGFRSPTATPTRLVRTRRPHDRPANHPVRAGRGRRASHCHPAGCPRLTCQLRFPTGATARVRRIGVSPRPMGTRRAACAVEAAGILGRGRWGRLPASRDRGPKARP